MTLELVKSIIGMSLILTVAMFCRHLSTSPNYKNLVKATMNFDGDVRWLLYNVIKNASATLYRRLDNVQGVKISSINYLQY